MAAAWAKVIRSGRSATSSQQLMPAILPQLGSPPVATTAGVGRPMHTGMIGKRGVCPQEQFRRMEQCNGKRFLGTEPPVPPPPHSFVALGAVSAVGLVISVIYNGPGLQARFAQPQAFWNSSNSHPVDNKYGALIT